MCGLTAIYAKKKNVVGDIYDSLIQVQHRGQDAAGISTWDGSKMSNYKDLGLVTEVFKKADSLNLEGNIGIGHVRYPTAGGAGKEFAHLCHSDAAWPPHCSE